MALTFSLEPIVPGPMTAADLFSLAGARDWLMRGFAMAGEVTIVSGKGGFGKSTLTLAIAVAMALGRAYGWWTPVRPLKVLIINGEEGIKETRRRLAAVCTAMRVDPSELVGKLFVVSDASVTEAGGVKLWSKSVARNGTTVIEDTPLGASIERLILECGADVLVLDPLVELHDSDENDNTQMAVIIGLMKSLAQKLKIAIVLVHHDRKGTTDATDAGRGASSIMAKGRLSITLAIMQEAEFKELKPEGVREDYFQVIVGKANYTKRSSGRWLQMREVESTVAGQDGIYDTIGVPMPFDVQAAVRNFNHVTWQHKNAFLDLVGPTGLYTTNRNAQGKRLDLAVIELFKIGREVAHAAIDAYEEAGWIVRERVADKNRNMREVFKLSTKGKEARSVAGNSDTEEMPF